MRRRVDRVIGFRAGLGIANILCQERDSLSCTNSPPGSNGHFTLFLLTAVQIALACLRDVSSILRTQTSPVIFWPPLRQLLQIGGPDSLLCDIRNLRTAPVPRRNDQCIR